MLLSNGYSKNISTSFQKKNVFAIAAVKKNKKYFPLCIASEKKILK